MQKQILTFFSMVGLATFSFAIISIIGFIISEIRSIIKTKKKTNDEFDIKQAINEVCNDSPARVAEQLSKTESLYIANTIKKFKHNDKNNFIEDISIKTTDIDYILEMTIKITPHITELSFDQTEEKIKFIETLKKYAFRMDDSKYPKITDRSLESFCVNLHNYLFSKDKYLLSDKFLINNGIYSIKYFSPVTISDNCEFRIRFSTELTEENPNNPPMGKYYFGCKVGNELFINTVYNYINETMELKSVDNIMSALEKLKTYILDHHNPFYKY